MSARYARYAVVLFLFFFASGFVSILVSGIMADDLHYKNGKKLSGEVVAFDYWSVTLKTLTGNIHVLKHELLRITFATPEKEKAIAKAQARAKELKQRKYWRRRYMDAWR